MLTCLLIQREASEVIRLQLQGLGGILQLTVHGGPSVPSPARLDITHFAAYPKLSQHAHVSVDPGGKYA